MNDDEPVREFTASEMNIFKGYDDFGVGKLAGVYVCVHVSEIPFT